MGDAASRREGATGMGNATPAAGALVMADRFVAWPFPVRKPRADWDEFDRDFIDFMRAAYAAGYRPRHLHRLAVEAESPTGRSAFLAYRGRHSGWEPFLSESGRGVRLGPSFGLTCGGTAVVYVRPPFRAAAHLALEWLRGRSLVSLLEDFAFVGGHPAGIELFMPHRVAGDRVAAVSAKRAHVLSGNETVLILIIEDNRDQADMLRFLLELYGHQVQVATTGRAGVHAAQGWLPDVVLCDIGLPGLDGWAVARALRRDPATATARLIAITGYGSGADRRRSQEAGFDCHLVKPGDPDALAALLTGGL
jgi:CheY-like chemotaxis protein